MGRGYVGEIPTNSSRQEMNRELTESTNARHNFFTHLLKDLLHDSRQTINGHLPSSTPGSSHLSFTGDVKAHNGQLQDLQDDFSVSPQLRLEQDARPQKKCTEKIWNSVREQEQWAVCWVSPSFSLRVHTMAFSISVIHSDSSKMARACSSKHREPFLVPPSPKTWHERPQHVERNRHLKRRGM